MGCACAVLVFALTLGCKVRSGGDGAFCGGAGSTTARGWRFAGDGFTCAVSAGFGDACCIGAVVSNSAASKADSPTDAPPMTSLLTSPRGIA
ncbi:MAG: hypothetical protein HOA08_22210 [Rhodospirillaceae bacterium]|jgi:hypothetical protein|nr:hypothetical protein [Rhodospirillaceae bacterium]MBT3491732.1 hypothetical protein [Rhodospirillaceae bacterium]MBT3783212.1 hypothetical protein [Rhodospirillaceae bacterium]MBT3978208.1 hypothetical protein [Rhodospirillaceae bacterium]MBT4169756.1 hypothetical protein [Rhodospirillaceae bacterium]